MNLFRHIQRIKLLMGLLLLLLASLQSCQKAEDLTAQVDQMVFVGDHRKIDGPIDEWVYQNLTMPYNIHIQWRFDRSETDLDRNITPVKEDKVLPLAEMLLNYYLKPYEIEGGSYFVKRYPPKLFVLLGSASYSSNGTVRLGSADAGRKIALYRLNDVDFSEYNASMERVLKTVHHEFGHILDQNRRVSPEYGLISNQSHYVEDQWNSTYDDAGTLHLDRGFITPYAGSQPSEDFVEVIATLLAYGQRWFDLEVARANAEGQSMLRQKEGIVVEYFKANWGIDFRALQKHIEDQKPAPPPPPPITDFFGESKQFNRIEMLWNNLAQESEALWASFDAESVAEADRVLSSYRLSLLDDGKLLIRVARFAAGAGSTGSASFARLFFDVTNNPDGTVSFAFSASGTDPFGTPNTGGSQTALRDNSSNLIQFLTSNKFVWDWTGENFDAGGLWALDANGVKTGQALLGVLGNY